MSLPFFPFSSVSSRLLRFFLLFSVSCHFFPFLSFFCCHFRSYFRVPIFAICFCCLPLVSVSSILFRFSASFSQKTKRETPFARPLLRNPELCACEKLPKFTDKHLRVRREKKAVGYAFKALRPMHNETPVKEVEGVLTRGTLPL